MTCERARDLAPGYVLDALDRNEEVAVRAHLATCPERHPEFAALGEVVPSLLELGDLELVEPPVSLGPRIMAAAAADLGAHPRRAAEAAPASAAPATASAPLPFPSADERETRRLSQRATRLDWAMRIAAVIAIVAVGAWGIGLQRQLDTARTFDTAVATVLQSAAQPGARTVVLAPAAGASATGIGAVGPDGRVVLAMRGLAPTTGSQVYEAWVIVGQKPVAVGGFTADANGTAAFTTRAADAPAGAVIALTLEPNPGNTAPLGPVVSAGAPLGPAGATS